MNKKIWNLIIIILFLIFLLFPTTVIKQYSEIESFTDYREEYKTLNFTYHDVNREINSYSHEIITGKPIYDNEKIVIGITNNDNIGGVFTINLQYWDGKDTDLTKGGHITTKNKYIDAYKYEEFIFNIECLWYHDEYISSGCSINNGKESVIAPKMLIKTPFTNYREVQKYKTIDIRMYQKIFGLY